MPRGPLRVGVAGMGFGRAVHVPAFRAAGCRVDAICASTAGRALAAARALRIPRAYGSWEELLEDPALDAVSLALPPDLQQEAAFEALRRGKAVFCEKPLALGARPARRLVAEALKSGLANVVDFEFPELRTFRRARALLEEGALGRLVSVRVTWKGLTRAHRLGLGGWKTRPERGGGVWFQFLPHVLHYVDGFLGPCRIARAEGNDRRAFLTLAGRVPIEVEVDTASSSRLHELSFQGERGTLLLRNAGTDYVRDFELSLEGGEVLREGGPADGDSRLAPVSRLVRRFAAWARGGAATGPDFAEAARWVERLERLRAP